MAGLEGRRILLIIGGGIAAYKVLETVRLLKRSGAKTRVILTSAGAKFVTEFSLVHLTGNRVYTDLFDISGEIEMGHIELSRDADLLVVAPATADLMAKMAHGHANDLASTALIATDKPVVIAPAMNVRMWHHRATQRNLAMLKEDGIVVVGPGDGDMACGEYGLGRLAEPVEIVAAIRRTLAPNQQALSGRSALVTAGPTHEPIDPVRYISNRSSGKQGYAIAAALAAAGVRTTLISGPTDLDELASVRNVHVQTATEMLAAVRAEMPVDIGVFAAAVADWRAEIPQASKIKKDAADTERMVLHLVENPDILNIIAEDKKLRPGLVIGFAAETDDLIKNAKEKLTKKSADWIVANDVGHERGVMGGERNRVHLLTREGVDNWSEMDKVEVAERLVRRIAQELSGSDDTGE
jgi:phosphopantothenoylcysteine decarboxylase/phosphopantothenate--cysteine ligase